METREPKQCYSILSMDPKQVLSVDSFSYSWLVSRKPSLDFENSLLSSLDSGDEALFIEMDPKMQPKKGFLKKSMDFNFDVKVPDPVADVVHADDVFHNGYVMPSSFYKPSKLNAMEVSEAAESPEIVVYAAKKGGSSSLRRLYSFSKELLKKYVDVLRVIILSVRFQRSRRSKSGMASPPRSVASGFDSDCPIYEAVLYCKGIKSSY